MLGGVRDDDRLVPPSMVDLARRNGAAGEAWVAGLPAAIAMYADRWGVELEGPLAGCGRAAWVGGGALADGTEVVLKLSWPHVEAATEAAGLRFFDGRGAARVVAADDAAFALLVERCRPGEDLTSLPSVEEADEVAV